MFDNALSSSYPTTTTGITGASFTGVWFCFENIITTPSYIYGGLLNYKHNTVTFSFDHICFRYPGTGEYDKFFDEGIYGCAGCGTPLYKSSTKFNSGCGWPAFYEGFPGAIQRTADPDGRRVEITCAACGGHLGHVFKGEGFNTPTDERHCVNSISLKFVPASEEEAS